MRTLGLVGSLVVAITLWAASSLPVFGDGPITVSVTAEAQACLTIQTTSINYGTVAFGGSSQRAISNIDSCSTVAQTLLGQGANTTTGPSWTLVDAGTCPTLPLNQFRHEVARTDSGTVLLSSSAAKPLGNMTAGQLDLELGTAFYMPCVGSAGAGQTATTTITLTAVLPGP